MGAGLTCAMNTCARSECDGREHVVDYVDHDRTLPDSQDGSETDGGDSSYLLPLEQSSMFDQVGAFAVPDPRFPAQMHPGMGYGGGSFMLTNPVDMWMQGRQGLAPGGASFAALQPRMPPGQHVQPGPGWQHLAVQGRSVPPGPGRPLNKERVTTASSPQHQQMLSHTGSVVSSRPWEESSNQNPSPVPTQLLNDVSETPAKQPVGSCHRLQSVPNMPSGLRTPIASHRGPTNPLGSCLGEPKPQGFQVIATVADFELGFDLFGAKIRDAALQAGHTSETMDNKFVSITDSYGRVFNWNRPLDFEPTVDMFPLMYRYTPPEDKSLGTGTLGMGTAPMSVRGSIGSRPNTASNLHSTDANPGGSKSLPNTSRRFGGGSENVGQTTLPMVMMAY